MLGDDVHTRLPEPLELVYDVLLQTVRRTWLLAPTAVTTALADLLPAANAVADVVVSIRGTSRPGHAGAIDARRNDEYTGAITDLDMAINQLVSDVRADLGIDGEPVPLPDAWVSSSG